MTDSQSLARARCSVFIVCCNEEVNIARAISSVSGFDEIVVVDSGSTDHTIQIARDLGAVVIERAWGGFADQKAFAMECCSHEWCLNIDADEMLSNALRDEVFEVLQRAGAVAYDVSINDVIADKPLHRWSRKRSIVRLFKKHCVRYPLDRSVHENVSVDGRVGRLKSEIVHYGYNDVMTYFAKHVRYAELRAGDKAGKGAKGSAVKLLLIFPFVFIKVFLFRGLLFSGWRGLIVAANESFYAFAKEAYLMARRPSNG